MKLEYPNPLLTMWRVMLSLPLALLWVAMFVCVLAGWGREEAGRFIDAWNNFACGDDNDDDDDLPPTARTGDGVLIPVTSVSD